MFFRRETPQQPTFAERLEMLKQAAFTVQPEGGGKAIVVRDGCAALIEDVPDGQPKISKAGFVIGQQIAELVDGGYQKTWRTPSGQRQPALATHLKALHALQQDLRETLGLASLYNESLGTVNDAHLYDRVAGR